MVLIGLQLYLTDSCSGPAKGYTEALEHRLRETETALLRLWHASSGDAIERAFPSAAEAPDSRIITSSERNFDPGRAKSSLITQWEEYPLVSAEDIRRWAADMEGETRAADSSQQQTLQPDLSQRSTQKSASSYNQPIQSTLPPEIPSTASGTNVELHFDQEGIDAPTSSRELSSLQNDKLTRVWTGSLDTESHQVDGRIEMSEEFRQQYLW